MSVTGELVTADEGIRDTTAEVLAGLKPAFKPDLAKGQAIAATCMACHTVGVDGGNRAGPGELRWYTTIDDVEEEFPDATPITHDGTTYYPRSRTFIPGDMIELLRATGYANTLATLPEPLLAEAAAFHSYMTEAQTIPLTFKDGAQIEKALEVAGGYHHEQLMRGAVAGQAVLQFNAGLQQIERFLAHFTHHAHGVFALQPEARVHQPVGQLEIGRAHV